MEIAYATIRHLLLIKMALKCRPRWSHRQVNFLPRLLLIAPTIREIRMIPAALIWREVSRSEYRESQPEACLKGDL